MSNPLVQSKETRQKIVQEISQHLKQTAKTRKEMINFFSKFYIDSNWKQFIVQEQKIARRIKETMFRLHQEENFIESIDIWNSVFDETFWTCN